MTGKEIFEMLYDGKIANNECIEVICEDEENHFILRGVCSIIEDEYYDFDYDELLDALLFKDYKFKIIKQKEAYKRLEEQEKEEKIRELEKQLKKLKGEE